MEEGSRISEMRDRFARARERVRRAFADFLTVPSCIIIGFLLLAAATYAADSAKLGWLAPFRGVLQQRVFFDFQATGDLLSTVAGSIITVTSITISLLLLALQQSAASMTAQVFDQFLRRRHNQAYFGFFVGLAVFCLITLATVGEQFNPVFGASVAFVLTVAALFMLIVLLYTTINQMRPEEIIEAIHGHTIAARTRLLPFVQATRREPRMSGGITRQVIAQRHGYVTRIDLTKIRHAARAAAGEVEVVIRVPIGTYVAFEDVIAEVRARSAEDAESLCECVTAATGVEQQRDVAGDPSFGIEELEMIAWTSISTAKSNPAPGLFTIRSMRNMLARWSVEEAVEDKLEPAPVVYHDDTLSTLMDALESLAVVSTESMQHQTFAEVMRTFSFMLERLPREQRPRAERLVLRSLAGLGDHMMTGVLDRELAALSEALARCGCGETAAAVDDARAGLAESVGKLNCRGSRVAEGSRR